MMGHGDWAPWMMGPGGQHGMMMAPGMIQAFAEGKLNVFGGNTIAVELAIRS